MQWEVHLATLLETLITNGLQIIIIAVLMFVSLKLIKVLSKRLVDHLLSNTYDIESEKKIRTLRQIIKSVLEVVVITIGVMMIIEKLGINIGPVIAAAGVVGLAVGFGSQRFVEDIISGLIILISDQVRVGDVVSINGTGGLVEKVDLKMVVLRDLSGNVHFIRNGKIDTVTNMTKDYSYYLFDIGVAYKENIERVIEVVKEIDEDIRQDERYKDSILEPLEVLGLDKFDDSAIIVKARIKTKPIKQWEVGRAFNLKLKKKFDEVGIEIPFPHRTLYFGDSDLLKVLNNKANS